MMLVIDHLERRRLSRGDNNIRHGIRMYSNGPSNRQAFARNIAGKTLISEKGLRIVPEAKQESAQQVSLSLFPRVCRLIPDCSAFYQGII